MLTRLTRTIIATLVLAGGLLATGETSVVSGHSDGGAARHARVMRPRAAAAADSDGCREEPAPLPVEPQGCVDPTAPPR